MRRILFSSLLISCLFSCSSKAQQSEYLLRFEDGEQYGYKTPDGEIVIPAGKYAMCFTDTFRTYAIVATEKGGFIGIDRSERELYEVFAYDNGPDDPAEGLFRITENGKIGFADAKTGTVRIEPKFLCADRFRYGIAAVSFDCRYVREEEYSRITGGNWSYIDMNGQPVPTTKCKTYSKEVIDSHVLQLDKLLKDNKLKEVGYPNKSSCGDALYGFYQGEQLHYIESNNAGGFGDTETNKKIWFKDSSVIKISITDTRPDLEAFHQKYPNKMLDDENAKLLTYTTSKTTVLMTDPVQIVQVPPAKAENVYTESDLKRTLECIESMMIELWSVPVIEAQLRESE